MRSCDGCTLCCKLPYIEELKKPTDTYCDHCHVNHGCNIYRRRPKECRSFECMWLQGKLPEHLKPDKVHCYAKQMDENYVQVKVDPAAQTVNATDRVVEHIITVEKLHVLVTCGNTLRFVGAVGKPRPQKIVLSWTL